MNGLEYNKEQKSVRPQNQPKIPQYSIYRLKVLTPRTEPRNNVYLLRASIIILVPQSSSCILWTQLPVKVIEALMKMWCLRGCKPTLLIGRCMNVSGYRRNIFQNNLLQGKQGFRVDESRRFLDLIQVKWCWLQGRAGYRVDFLWDERLIYKRFLLYLDYCMNGRKYN